MPKLVPSLEVLRPVTNMRYHALSPLRGLIRERVIRLAGDDAANSIRFNRRAEIGSLLLSRGEIFGFMKEQILPQDPSVLDRLPQIQEQLQARMRPVTGEAMQAPIFPERVYELPGGGRQDRYFITLGERGDSINTERFAAQRLIHELFDQPTDEETIADYWDEGNTPPPGYIFASFRSSDPDRILDSVALAVEAARDEGLIQGQFFEFGGVRVDAVPLTR